MKEVSSATGRCHLNSACPFKPLDFGGYGIAGSLDRDGGFTAVNACHPRHGYVSLTTAEPFGESARFDVDEVRRYRARLVELRGFGLRFEAEIEDRETWLLEGAVPYVKLTLAGGPVAEATTCVAPGDPGRVVQLWDFSGTDATKWRFSGTVTLQRSAYTQLTEGGPVPPPSPATNAHLEKNVLALENPELGWAVGLACEEAVISARPAGRGRVKLEAAGCARPGTSLTLCLAPAESVATARARLPEALPAREARDLVQATLDEWGARWREWSPANHPLEMIARRGMAYGLLCAVPVEDTVCFVTDHQLLPLSWNRDAYYVAQALLLWPSARDTVRRHLRWTFEVAERPATFWGRSHTTDGSLKDPAFQLDQQLYPLLELAEYTEATGDEELLDRLRPRVEEVLQELLSIQDRETGLFSTDETPSDDPISMPFHFSSHVLLWHTLSTLAPLLDTAELGRLAAQVREATRRNFTVESGGRPIFAYVVDGRGGYRLYHDAGDLPTALAPIWGFCASDDPVWRATVEFGFSERNTGGYFPGPFGGLGSVHTPGAWPLGDIQELIIAHATGNRELRRSATTRLSKTALWDGALPEAYSPADGSVISRHWFSWPAASVAWIVGSLDGSGALAAAP